MDRTIEVQVNANFLSKDNDVAGVQGEANVTTLRITFDPSWDGYAKKVLFWDAKGENPVRRILTVDMLENVAKSTRVYLCPIPGEPLAEAGRCEFVVEGYLDGKRARTVGDTLKVKASPYTENDAEPADLTPTQVEQLQAQIDFVIDDIKAAVQIAETADEAKATADAALIAADRAEEMMKTGTHAARHATGGDDPLDPDMIGAATKEAVTAAQSAADRAQSTADAAQTAANAAQTTANDGKSAAATAQTAANNAQATANSAATAAANANANADQRLSIYGGTVNGRVRATALEVTDYGTPFEAPRYIDFHLAGSANDYDARLYIDGNGELYLTNASGTNKLTHAGNFTKSTTDIGEGVAMAAGSWYAVYE